MNSPTNPTAPPSGYGFEAGELVPLAAEPTLDPITEALFALEDLGAHFKNPTDAARVLERLWDAAGTHHCVSMLRFLDERLERTAAGLALRRVIHDDSGTLEEAAKQAGCSRPAIFLQQQTVSKRLFGEKPNKTEA